MDRKDQYWNLPGYPCAWSDSKAHRYTLWRVFSTMPPKRIFCCIALNPSTATEVEDDPTVGRVIGFAQREKCDALVMLNIFAFRATDPEVMKANPDPIGKENDEWLMKCTSMASVVLAAWGTHGEFMGRGARVAAMIPNMYCLGTNKGGSPKHPLYVDAGQQLVRY